MSYTIEVYRREMKASRHLVDYMAFVTFWPHLVAGPIMRAHNLLRQLELIRPVISTDETRYALMLIAWGLFKKIVLADNFGYIVLNRLDLFGKEQFCGRWLAVRLRVCRTDIL